MGSRPGWTQNAFSMWYSYNVVFNHMPKKQKESINLYFSQHATGCSLILLKSLIYSYNFRYVFSSTNGQSYPFQQYYPTPYKYHIYKSIFNLKRLLGILLQITEPSSICHIGISKDWQTFMYSLQTLLPKLSLLSFSQCHHLQVHIMAGLTISYINNVGLKKKLTSEKCLLQILLSWGNVSKLLISINLTW